MEYSDQRSVKLAVRVWLSKDAFKLCKDIVMCLRFTSLTNILHVTSSDVLRLEHGVGVGGSMSFAIKLYMWIFYKFQICILLTNFSGGGELRNIMWILINFFTSILSKSEPNLNTTSTTESACYDTVALKSQLEDWLGQLW